MATNDNNNTYPSPIDIPLYVNAKLTRQQAINEIGDVILRSNMKPQIVQYTLQLIQKLLPIENTLPKTMEDLFSAIGSSEHDGRLTQYLIKYNQNPSFLPSANHLNNENNSISMFQTNLFTNENDDDEESNSLIYDTCACCNHNDNELLSNSDEENELSSYDRLQQCLQPILNINHMTTLSSQNRNNEDERHFNPLWRIFDRFTDDTDEELPSNDRRKLCCFEINGHDLLNGGKRRRY